MAQQQVQEFAMRVRDRLEDRIESIVAYSHPFTKGGLVIIFRNDIEFMPDLIAEVYDCNPPGITLYCLRQAEIFQISSPGVFGWPNPLEEKPLLAYRVKFGGEVLYGRNICDEIAIPEDAVSLLEAQLQRCKQFVRNWTLDQFRRRNYAGIIRELNRQSMYLMSIALLRHNEWDAEIEIIPDRFEVLLKDSETKRLWADINSMSFATASAEQSPSRELAAESVWLFENVMQSIGRHAQ
jgi:hypothetical protein